MAAFLVLIMIVAVGAWLVAAVSAISLVGLAPAGSRLATLFDLGWWRFATIESRIGPSAHSPIARYRKSFIVFFLCVLAGILATFALAPNTAASG